MSHRATGFAGIVWTAASAREWTASAGSISSASLVVPFAIGVALFVAIIGTPGSLQERITAYHRGWWIVTALSLFSIIPNQLLIGRRK
jgi:hypothetical protein